jgi:hypothetical protein
MENAWLRLGSRNSGVKMNNDIKIGQIRKCSTFGLYIIVGREHSQYRLYFFSKSAPSIGLFNGYVLKSDKLICEVHDG